MRAVYENAQTIELTSMADAVDELRAVIVMTASEYEPPASVVHVSMPGAHPWCIQVRDWSVQHFASAVELTITGYLSSRDGRHIYRNLGAAEARVGAASRRMPTTAPDDLSVSPTGSRGWSGPAPTNQSDTWSQWIGSGTVSTDRTLPSEPAGDARAVVDAEAEAEVFWRRPDGSFLGRDHSLGDRARRAPLVDQLGAAVRALNAIREERAAPAPVVVEVVEVTVGTVEAGSTRRKIRLG